MIPAVVRLVEKLIGGGKGDEKKALAVEILKVLIPVVEKASGRDLVDDKDFAEAVGDLIDGVVGALNAIGALKKD
jgi:hypothetical protein